MFVLGQTDPMLVTARFSLPVGESVASIYKFITSISKFFVLIEGRRSPFAIADFNYLSEWVRCSTPLAIAIDMLQVINTG